MGTAPILFHRYDDVSVARKATAAKNSQARKVDDVESYVYRTSTGEIGIPGKNFKACLREAGRSLPDPRSPRTPARELIQSALQIEPFIASLGREVWDSLDVQRVLVQRNAISRARPMFHEGWRVGFDVIVLAPEDIVPDWLHDLISRAGRFVGFGGVRQLVGGVRARRDGRGGRAWTFRGDRAEFLGLRPDLEPNWATFDLRSVAWPDAAVVGFVVAPPIG